MKLGNSLIKIGNLRSTECRQHVFHNVVWVWKACRTLFRVFKTRIFPKRRQNHFPRTHTTRMCSCVRDVRVHTHSHTHTHPAGGHWDRRSASAANNRPAAANSPLSLPFRVCFLFEGLISFKYYHWGVFPPHFCNMKWNRKWLFAHNGRGSGDGT